MSEVLDVSSIIDDEAAIASFTALLGQPFDAVDPKDNVKCFGELNNISWVELKINKKEFTFRFHGKKWKARIGNFLFFAYFINQLSDRNIPFFFVEDTNSYDNIDDVCYNITLHDCIHFRFEIHFDALILTRIAASSKFKPNKYRGFDILKRYSSIN